MISPAQELDSPEPPNTPAGEVAFYGYGEASVNIILSPSEVVITEKTYEELLESLKDKIYRGLMTLPQEKWTKEEIYKILSDIMATDHLFKFTVEGYDFKVQVPVPTREIKGSDILI